MIPLSELSAAFDKREIVLRYRLANSLEETLYVLNRLERERRTEDGWETAPSSEIAFVCHERDDLALFYQGPAPLSSGDEQQRLPGASRLEVGAVLQGVVRVTMPLLEWHALAPPRSRSTCQILTINQVHLRLAFLRESDTSQVSELQTCPGVWSVQGERLATFEGLVQLPMPCELQRRLDDFTRFV